MKELSIEEKAKRYDKALKVLHKYDGANIMFSQSLKEEMFPELAESKDESIRKTLIKVVNLYYGEGEDEEKTACLNWLEKQGEQKPVFEMITPEESLGIDSNTYNKIVDECVYGELKPAWSEEDEAALGDALWCCKQAASIAKDENDMGNIWYTERWLKSLKDRVQPKIEWSERDELMLEESIGFIKSSPYPYAGDTLRGEISKTEAENWLNSLRDRVQSPAKKEWSEKDKKILEIITSVLQVNFGPTEKFLGYEEYMNVDLINWLKSLRPQSKWKLKDEHYELEEFAKIVRSNLTGINKSVQELFEAKYLQLTGNKMYGGFKD